MKKEFKVRNATCCEQGDHRSYVLLCQAPEFYTAEN